MGGLIFLLIAVAAVWYAKVYNSPNVRAVRTLT